jgi:hypothetical protein
MSWLRALAAWLLGSLIIFVVAWLTIRWVGARTLGQQLAVGAAWVALMVAFEFALGTVLGYSRARGFGPGA